MGTSETTETYVGRVQSLTNSMMKTFGEIYTEQAKVEKILRTLTPRFEHVVAAIGEGNDTSQMMLKTLSGSLRAHDQQLMNGNMVEKPVEQVLPAQASSEEKKHKGGVFRGRGRECSGNN